MSAQVITPEEFQPIVDMIKELHREVQVLKKLARKNVGTEEAMEVTGLSRRVLDYERLQPGSKLKWSKVGRKVLYDLESLLAFNESKCIKNPDVTFLKLVK